MAYHYLDKIQIRLSGGLANYSGYIRGHRFVDGVSVAEIPIQEVLAIGSAMQVFNMDGAQVSPVLTRVDYSKMTSQTTQTVEPVRREPEPEPEPDEFDDEAVGFYAPNEQMASAKVWTAEELELIADAEGIQGLREIAAEFDVKERSITGLIEGIVEAQEKAKE